MTVSQMTASKIWMATLELVGKIYSNLRSLSLGMQEPLRSPEPGNNPKSTSRKSRNFDHMLKLLEHSFIPVKGSQGRTYKDSFVNANFRFIEGVQNANVNPIR